jgi:hypothetical protein
MEGMFIIIVTIVFGTMFFGLIGQVSRNCKRTDKPEVQLEGEGESEKK